MSSQAKYLIFNECLRVELNSFGAELLSLRDSSGLEYMTDADPAFWSGHAPILFPIVGALVDGKFRHQGTTYALPRHGFARRSLFTLMEQSEDAVRFALADSAQTRAAYPFAFRLEMAYRLVGATLHMTATVHNSGEGVLPFSFGYHPAFAWPLPHGGAKEQHSLIFEQDEPAPIYRVAKGTGDLLPDTEASPVQGRELVLRESLFEADAVIWKDLASRKLTYASPEGPALDISFPDTPDLGLWQVPGARYICIEPWAGHADPQGFDGELVQKPGILTLAPGESHSLRMDVTVRSG